MLVHPIRARGKQQPAYRHPGGNPGCTRGGTGFPRWGPRGWCGRGDSLGYPGGYPSDSPGVTRGYPGGDSGESWGDMPCQDSRGLAHVCIHEYSKFHNCRSASIYVPTMYSATWKLPEMINFWKEYPPNVAKSNTNNLAAGNSY